MIASSGMLYAGWSTSASSLPGPAVTLLLRGKGGIEMGSESFQDPLAVEAREMDNPFLSSEYIAARTDCPLK